MASNELKFLLTSVDQTEAAYRSHAAAVREAAKAHGELTEAAKKSAQATDEHTAAKADSSRQGHDDDPKGESVEQKTTRLQKLGSTAKEAAEAVASIWAANELSEATVGRYVEAERAMLSLKQTLGVTSEAFGEVREQVEAIAKISLGETNESIAAVFERAKELGAQGAEGPAEFARVVSEMANVTQMSAGRVASSMGMILQASGEGAEGAKRFGDTFTDLSRSTVGGAEALMATTLQLQGVASGFKITSEQMLAVAAAGSSLGVEGSRFGMAFTQSLLAMQHAADDGGLALNDLSQNMGLTREGFRDLIKENPTAAFTRLLVVMQHLSAQGKSVSDFMREIGVGGRGMEAAMRAAYQHIPQFQSLLDRSNNPSAAKGSLDRDNKEVMETVSAAEKNLRDSAHNLFEGVGAAFAPTLIPMVEALTGAVNTVAAAFNMLPAPLRTVVASFLLLTPSIIAGQKAWFLYKEILEGGSAALGRAGGMLGLIVRSAREVNIAEEDMSEMTGVATEASTAHAAALTAESTAAEMAAVKTSAAAKQMAGARAMMQGETAVGEAVAVGAAGGTAAHVAGTEAVEAAVAGGAATKAAMAEAGEASVMAGEAVTVAGGEAVAGAGLFARAALLIEGSFAAIGGPVGIAVGAIILGISQIYEHWDGLLKLFDKSPADIFESLKQTIQTANNFKPSPQRPGSPTAAHRRSQADDPDVIGQSRDPYEASVRGAMRLGERFRQDGAEEAAKKGFEDFEEYLKSLWSEPLRGAKEGAREGEHKTEEQREEKARQDQGQPIIVRDPRLLALDDTIKKSSELLAIQESIDQLRKDAANDPAGAAASQQGQEQIAIYQRIHDLRVEELDPMFKITTQQTQQLAAARALTKADSDRVALTKQIQDLAISNPKLNSEQLGSAARTAQSIQEADISKAYTEEAIGLENARQKAAQMTTLGAQRVEIEQQLATMVRRSGYSDEQIAAARALLETTQAINNAKEQENKLNSTGQANRDYQDQLSTLATRSAPGGDLAGNPNAQARERRALDNSTLAARDPYAEQIQKAEDLTAQLKLIGDYQEADRKTLQFVNEEYDKGIDLTREQVQTLTDVNRQTEDIQRNQSGGFQGWANSLGTLQTSLNSIESTFASGIASTIYSSFGKLRNRFAFRDFFKDLSGKIFEQAVDQTIKAGMQATGIIGSSGSSGATGGSIFDNLFGQKSKAATAPSAGALAAATMTVHATTVMVNGGVVGSGGGSGVGAPLNVPVSAMGPLPTGDTAGSAALIRKFEGFRTNAYPDPGNGLPRVGYGSDTITDPMTGEHRATKLGDVTTENAANLDLARRIQAQQAKDRGMIGSDAYDKLTTGERAAITDASYNYTTLPKNVVSAAKTGDADQIASSLRAHSGDNGGINAARREQEAQVATQKELSAATREATNAAQTHAQATSMTAMTTQTATTAQTGLNAAASSAASSVGNASVALKNVTAGTGIAGSPAASPSLLSNDQSTMANAVGAGGVGALGQATGIPMLGTAFSWISKLFSGFTSIPGGLSAFKFHEGGVVGMGGTPITIPSSMLAGAQRYHNGLNDDEYPAVLQQGERVMTAQQNAMAMRVASGAASSGSSNVQSPTGNFSVGDLHVHQTVVPTGNPASDQAAAQMHSKALSDGLHSAMDTWAQKNMRPGGMLSHASVKGGQR